MSWVWWVDGAGWLTDFVLFRGRVSDGDGDGDGERRWFSFFRLWFSFFV